MVYELTVQSVKLKSTLFTPPSRLINTCEVTCAIGMLYKKAGQPMPEVKAGDNLGKLIESIPQQVYDAENGNPQILDEMIYNLCDNAIKYNKPFGEVEVNVSMAKEHPVLTVEDDGIGIPVDDQARIFERFYRVDKSHSRQIGGTGLGLSIVKHGAIYHKAKVELKSALGEGTTVRIVF